MLELGDTVSVSSITSVLNKADIQIGNHTANISYPGDEEIDHEYPYLTTIERTQNRTVNLNATYFGTTISRKNGLTIEKLVDDEVTAKAVFNSDILTMQALKDGSWVDKIYFDAATGNYVFDGELSADVINALSVLITPNLYAEKSNHSRTYGRPTRYRHKGSKLFVKQYVRRKLHKNI